MSAKLIKELRNRTNAGFLDCKKALDASENNIDKAIIWLQKKGVAKATKKANAIAAEGVVITKSNDKSTVIFELNSQTDFVSRNSDFKKLYENISEALLINDFNDIDEAKQIKIGDDTIQNLIIKATATIGEKIQLRRALKINSENNVIGAYTHSNNRVAAIVVAKGNATPEIVRNVAMHVASMNPTFVDSKDVDEKKLKEIKNEINKSSALKDKPENIREKIFEGMLRKKLSEITLVDQEFVMEKMTVFKYLSQYKTTAIKMVRYELGEGIVKKEEDFSSEVKSQMKI